MIDTAAKRNSAIATRRLPWLRRFAPIPDGSVDQGDRQQLAFVYRGIEAEEAVTGQPGVTFLEPRRGNTFVEPRRGNTFVEPRRS